MIIIDSPTFRKIMCANGYQQFNGDILDHLDDEVIMYLNDHIVGDPCLGIALEHLGLLHPKNADFMKLSTGTLGYSVLRGYHDNVIGETCPMLSNPKFMEVITEDNQRLVHLSMRELLSLLPDEYPEETNKEE